VKILVIGNGFIATSIVHKLEAEGHEILVYSRTFNERIKSKQILGDIFLFDDFVCTLLWQPQIVINTAWITTPGIYRDDPSNYKYAEFAASLARHVIQSDVEHLIFLGTCAEYGDQIQASTAGTTKLSPKDLYSKQKVEAFNSIKCTLLNSKIRFTWARIFYPYGPMQNPNRLIPYLIRSIKSGTPVNLSNTSSILDWITTRDVALAITWIINNESPIELDIGTSYGFTNIEILKHLEELLGTTRQWARYSSLHVGPKLVSVVGKDSPLIKLGWLANDDLYSGLEWVLSS
jgi:dTDP-6-deoxy-L-talose 4-dehydrogenase (NAD+)